MAGIHGDLIKLRRHAVDAEGLVTQLPGLDHLILKADIHLHALLLRAHMGQILGRHIPVPPIRAGDLVPRGCGLVYHDDLSALLVLAEDSVPCPRA